MNNKLTTKIAKDIALKSFGHITDGILGYSDSYYYFDTDISEFEQNFEEDMIEKGINPTHSKIQKINKEFEKIRKSFEELIRKKYY